MLWTYTESLRIFHYEYNVKYSIYQDAEEFGPMCKCWSEVDVASSIK